MPSGTAQRPVRRHHDPRRQDRRGAQHRRRGPARARRRASSPPARRTPTSIVDVATLTGAQVVALGNRMSAVMANDDALRSRIHEIADAVGEQFWPMPLPPELRSSLDSPVADIANMGERFGGMLIAGLFLSEFVPKIRATDEPDAATSRPRRISPARTRPGEQRCPGPTSTSPDRPSTAGPRTAYTPVGRHRGRRSDPPRSGRGHRRRRNLTVTSRSRSPPVAVAVRRRTAGGPPGASR